ncbi:hypothetical protein R6Z07M_007917 [Ovis aries]
MAPDAVRAAPAGIRTQAPSGLPYRRGLLRAACRRRPLGSSSRAAAGGPETRVSLDRFRGRGLGARPGLGDSDGKRAASAPSEPVGPVRAGCAGDIGFGSDPGPGGRPGSAPRPGSASCLTFRPEAQGNTWAPTAWKGTYTRAPGLRPDAGQGPAGRPCGAQRSAHRAPRRSARPPASPGPPGRRLGQDKLPPRPRQLGQRQARGGGLARTRWTGAGWTPAAPAGRRLPASTASRRAARDPGRGRPRGPVPRGGGRAARPRPPATPQPGVATPPPGRRAHTRMTSSSATREARPQAPPCYLTAAAASTSRRHEAPRRGPALR